MWRLLGGECGKTDEKMWIHGMPLSRWWGFGVCWVWWPDEKGGALLSIAAPSMPCEANRPLTSHAERNQVKQWVCHTRRCVASVSFYGDNPPHGKLQEILVAEDKRFELSGGFEPPTVFKTAAINRSANPPVGCAGRDLNPRSLAYEASELPDCSTAQFFVCLLSKNGDIIAYII